MGVSRQTFGHILTGAQHRSRRAGQWSRIEGGDDEPKSSAVSDG
jgi:hypothetical protein